jgi:hypothetical protein
MDDAIQSTAASGAMRSNEALHLTPRFARRR